MPSDLVFLLRHTNTRTIAEVDKLVERYFLQDSLPDDKRAVVEAARKIAAALPGARGPLCFQAIVREDGEYAVFEINARFGGGYPLAHRAGATFSKWLLEEAAGLSCSAHDDWKAGVTMLRYDAAVFLDD